jgi:Fe2+ or Zn2+ uptake regulation protein
MSEVTARDRVWAAIMEQRGRFKVSTIAHEIEIDERPSDETIRRVLRAAVELGVIEHKEGSPYYKAPLAF